MQPSFSYPPSAFYFPVAFYPVCCRFKTARSNSMDPLPSSNYSDAGIWDIFHRQLNQYGHELSSFVSAELGEPPSGLSITLETIEWPESLANWVWCVGSADPATERAVLRFFQTDVGKRALSADGVEFKLASALLRLPSGQPNDSLTYPAGFTPAAAPLQDGRRS
jgi:hypothetical protein